MSIRHVRGFVAGNTPALALAVLLATASAARAEEPAGDWVGVLKSPAVGDLTVAVHLKKGASGYEGALDDVTLAARGIHLTNVQAGESRLVFDVPAAQGHYEAAWNAAAGRWDGIWTSPGVNVGVPFNLTRGAPPPPIRAAGVDGDWRGALNAGPAGIMRLVFHVRTTEADGTTVVLDSPDQGVTGTPVGAASRNGREVTFDARGINAKVVGELSPDGSRIQGEFTQGPQLMPLVLTRASDAPMAPPTPPRGSFQELAAWTAPDDAAIRAILARRIDVERRGVGIVVGVITPKGRRVVAYGKMGVNDPRPVDGETLFEIGSISKPFTSIVLSDMALKGQVALDDPVAKYLPPGTVVPSKDAKPITLRELATHMAALPHDLPNPQAKRIEDQFGATSEADLYKFLASYQLPRDPGAEWEYSNLGVGMLGLALARRNGTDIETMLRTRVWTPLGMTSTAMTITPALQPRLATGHDAYLRPVPPFQMGPAEAAAGQIRSSANDMLKLLAAELGYQQTPLKPAMDAMLTVDGPGMQGGFRQALGWMKLTAPNGTFITHSGGTFGQRAFAAFNPKTQVGVIVLTNAEGVAGADDIGLWAISGQPVREYAPAPPPPPADKRETRAEQPIREADARPLLGRYRMSRSVVIVVSYADGHLTAHTEAQGHVGPDQPLAWHGGADFTAPNGAGDEVSLAFQRDGASPAKALSWRGPVGEYILARDSGG